MTSIIPHIEGIRALLSLIVSWRTLALLLAIINLKNLPLAWHVRILRHFVTNIRSHPKAPFFPKGKAIASHTGNPTHPVFVPYGITSRAPLLETDYNLHKSNSTYFSDLDISRTALVTRLYSPGAGMIGKELDAEFAETARREGKAPPPRKSIYVALGSVFCTFKREIKPFALYEIESKVLAWDQKWMYIQSFFLKPADQKGGKRKLYATAVSKYVVKKGRLTIPPEKVLRKSGFLPPRPEGVEPAPASTSSPMVDSSTEASGTGTPAGITAAAAAAAAGVDGSLVREVLKLQDGDIPESTTLEAEKNANAGLWDEREWTWERIEEERLRGMRVLDGFYNLDVRLIEEWEA
ncbi:hypothetical protein AOCH_003276 [Aspergillus ochraceoroseus]|nr:hypothetical protein AOCH_003276 [Aspergillus ochraceoroseus]